MNGSEAVKEQRFIAIYRLYVDEIYQYVYLRTGLRSSLAEELTQETFLSVYKGLSHFKGLCSDRTWVFRIAKNKLNDHYRKCFAEKSKIVSFDESTFDQLIDTDEDAQELLWVNIERERVKACLHQLPQQYQIVLVQKYVEGKSTKELASIVNKTPKAIESILQRAKRAFAKHYAACDDKEEL